MRPRRGAPHASPPLAPLPGLGELAGFRPISGRHDSLTDLTALAAGENGIGGTIETAGTQMSAGSASLADADE